MTSPSSERQPTGPEILERASSLANEAMHAVALQRRRVRSQEPEDETFLLRTWVDLQFLIVALRRLRQAAVLAQRVPSVADRVSAALKKFDDTLPGLRTMRNVGEHIEDYAMDAGRERHIHRKLLQVGGWDGTTYQWLDLELNVDTAHDAAAGLYMAVRDSAKSISKKP